LAGTLGGAGTVSLERLELAGLDPAAFDAVVRSTDEGAEVDAAKVKALVERSLENSRFKVARAAGSLVVTAGQLRLSGITARGERADLDLAASVDLVQGVLDARLALFGSAPDLDMPAYGRPEIVVALKGPVTAPNRSVDVSTFVGWLTLRSVDVQAKRLEAAEGQRKAADEAAGRIEAAARRASEEAAKRAADAAARRSAEESARRAAPSPAPAPLGEQAPTLPPPVDIRPLPGQRRPSAQRVPPRPLPEQEVGLRPPPSVPPQPSRSLMDSLFGRPR
jgi:large subunit ribosomal protein L24